MYIYIYTYVAPCHIFCMALIILLLELAICALFWAIAINANVLAVSWRRSLSLLLGVGMDNGTCTLGLHQLSSLSIIEENSWIFSYNKHEVKGWPGFDDHEYLTNTQGSQDKWYSWLYEHFLIVDLNFKTPNMQSCICKHCQAIIMRYDRMIHFCNRYGSILP